MDPFPLPLVLLLLPPNTLPAVVAAQVSTAGHLIQRPQGSERRRNKAGISREEPQRKIQTMPIINEYARMRPSHSLSQSGKSFPTKPEARTMVNGASQKNRIVPSTSRNDHGSVRPSQLAA